jgi:hypothetical protein
MAIEKNNIEPSLEDQLMETPIPQPWARKSRS